jgi:hypothetical protein
VRSEVNDPAPRSSAHAQVMIESLAQPVAANVFETFRDNEAVLSVSPRMARDNLRCGSVRCE